jgi:hypothetical protein
MNRLKVLTTDQHAEWAAVLEQTKRYDFYHLPQYHSLAEEWGEGSGRLFVYTEGPFTIALPLLLRPLAPVPGVEQLGAAWKDATSVYGYAGPVTSHAAIPPEVAGNFQTALRERLESLGVVAVFSRLHPQLPQQALLGGLGEYRRLGPTVSIDLTLPPAVQRAGFRKNHKEGINRLRRAGVTTWWDQGRTYLREFVPLYHQTMRRVQAAAAYFFPCAYFEGLCAVLSSRAHLFVSLLGGRLICGVLVVECNGFLQYHLGGTEDEFVRRSPMKLLIDDVRLWATGRGLSVFHLGGGVTSQPDDSLLHFKAGFSDRRHDFCVWRWVLCPDIYRQAVAAREQWNERHGLRVAVADYFPAYRPPTFPAETVPTHILSAEGP